MRPGELETRLQRLEQQLRAITRLHADELQLILDELAALRAAVGADEAAAPTAPPADDPAAASPKRAKWQAEQQRRGGPASRRELLLGRPDPREKAG